jgi:hypothetical protein
MFFLIGKNPYFDDLNKHTNQNYINKQIEAIEIQLKKKYERLEEFDPEDCYNSKFSDDVEFADSEEINFSELISEPDEKEKKTKRQETVKRPTTNFKRSPVIQEKISLFKRIFKIMDILATILILFGAALSQYEQDTYYYDNIFYRVTAVVIINYVYLNPKNHSLDVILSEKNVNLTLLTNNPTTNLEDISNATSILQPGSNKYFLSKLNMTKFNYNESITDFTYLEVPMQISPTSETLRSLILMTTLISCLLIVLSRYIEHRREYFYKNEFELVFHKGEYFFYSVVECFLLLLIQYPKLNSYIIFSSLGTCYCLPISTILSSISIFRFIFIGKFFKHFTVWNSEMAEYKCENSLCHADMKFAFKAIQKENPLLALFAIFVLTCLCFGFSLRNFELHYWESQSIVTQNWSYYWNAMWCVFVSMTTVGYGDFYPKTHPGRFIIVMACLIGIYFVSMMMVLMTQKSILNESEQKAYKLITRLKMRNDIKEIHAKIVWHSLQIANFKKLKSQNLIDEKNFEMSYSHQRRCIIKLIEAKKAKERNIKQFELIPTKEQLFDICERIESDIKEIRNEIEALSYLNDSVIGYTESQVDMMRYLKKNIFATKLMFNMIDKKPSSFGQLAYYDPAVLTEDDLSAHQQTNMTFTTNVLNLNRSNDLKTQRTKVKYSNNKITKLKSTEIKDNTHNVVNPNQFDENIYKKGLSKTKSLKFDIVSSDENAEDNYADELVNYNVTPEEMKLHFYNLFFSQGDLNSDKKFLKKNSLKTMKTIKSIKKTQSKLKMISGLKNRRSLSVKSGKNMMSNS